MTQGRQFHSSAAVHDTPRVRVDDGVTARGPVTTGTPSPVRLGIRANLAQFILLVVVNAFVGGMIGLERTLLPTIAEHEFHMVAKAAVLSFIVVFGVSKAFTNYLAGRLADRFGRKPVLVGGWLIAVPVPFLLMWAPTWSWVLVANALLGVSQGLTWSTTVIMKIDLAGPQRRGLAMGWNEFAGYAAVAMSALVTAAVAARYGLRPQPFYLGVGFVVVGSLLSIFLVRETKQHVAVETNAHAARTEMLPTPREVFWRTSFGDKDLSSVSQAGLVNNLNDGMAWGLFPLFFSASGLAVAEIGSLAAVYPATWGIAQIFTGAWSDRLGRKWMIAAGMWVQAGGIALIVSSGDFAWFAIGAALLGLGTAMVYPTLLAAIGDVADPRWRASAVGVYRLWRDLGYAFGALLAGLTADALGLSFAMWLVAVITFASGVVVAIRMTETVRRTAGPPCVELAELLHAPAAVIIDVRDPQAFAAGHVAGAINIPFDELAVRASGIPRDARIVTVCGTGGGRSARAAAFLLSQGWPSVRSLCGGTQAWLRGAVPA